MLASWICTSFCTFSIRATCDMWHGRSLLNWWLLMGPCIIFLYTHWSIRNTTLISEPLCRASSQILTFSMRARTWCIFKAQRSFKTRTCAMIVLLFTRTFFRSSLSSVSGYYAVLMMWPGRTVAWAPAVLESKNTSSHCWHGTTYLSPR